MEQALTPDLLEFRGLIDAIRTEIDLMKTVILSDEEEKEENEILSKFKAVVEMQVYSTIMNIGNYQIREWRELVDE